MVPLYDNRQYFQILGTVGDDWKSQIVLHSYFPLSEEKAFKNQIQELSYDMQKSIYSFATFW